MYTEILKQGRGFILVHTQSLDNKGIAGPVIVIFRLTKLCVLVILFVPIASQDCHQRVKCQLQRAEVGQ